ncbi:hypothetical protein EDB89DRAFT_2233478 [Lactarius sanguifluus]|nr:hypothetical protein EDB89DRAFT_2233478 [Lactarius sanguifluus]
MRKVRANCESSAKKINIGPSPGLVTSLLVPVLPQLPQSSSRTVKASKPRFLLYGKDWN